MEKINKVFNFKVICLALGISLLFNINLYSYPKDTLRIPSSFQHPKGNKKITEVFLRETLKDTPIKEIALSAQFKVLTSDKLDIVIRMPKTREETEFVFRQWGLDMGMSGQDFERLVDRVHAGKKEGTRIFKEKLLYSSAIWGIMELDDVYILEETEDGNIPRREEKLYIQKKGDKVLRQAISEHYEKREIDKIKEILNQVIYKIQEEIWGYGVYDKTFSFPVNWGVDYLQKGIDVRLFDFWEVTDNKPEAIERLKKHIEQFDKTWEIMDKQHPLSIINLTDEEIARWFLGRIKEEFTLEKLEQCWGKKSKKMDGIDNRLQLLKVQEAILQNL